MKQTIVKYWVQYADKGSQVWMDGDYPLRIKDCRAQINRDKVSYPKSKFRIIKVKTTIVSEVVK